MQHLHFVTHNKYKQHLFGCWQLVTNKTLFYIYKSVYFKKKIKSISIQYIKNLTNQTTNKQKIFEKKDQKNPFIAIRNAKSVTNISSTSCCTHIFNKTYKCIYVCVCKIVNLYACVMWLKGKTCKNPLK